MGGVKEDQGGEQRGVLVWDCEKEQRGRAALQTAAASGSRRGAALPLYTSPSPERDQRRRHRECRRTKNFVHRSASVAASANDISFLWCPGLSFTAAFALAFHIGDDPPAEAELEKARRPDSQIMIGAESGGAIFRI